MTTLQESLEDFREFLVTEPFNMVYSGTNPKTYKEYGTGKGNMLRLDWELNEKLVGSSVLENHQLDAAGADAMIVIIENDFQDLIDNGDVNSNDPLLRVLNGAGIHGRAPDNVEIVSAMMFAEPKPRKETIEFTVYFRLLVEWND